MELIDKEAAYKELSEYYHHTTFIQHLALSEALNRVPVVDAEPVRHGKWKKIRGTINCSACKSCSWSMPFEDLVTSFNYCPNCGAKMDVEHEKANDKKMQTIKVGDVVTVKDSNDMVVIEISVYEYDNNSLAYTCVDKKTGKVWHYNEDADIKKTGEHYILPWG